MVAYPFNSKGMVGGLLLLIVGLYFLFNGDLEHAATIIGLALGVLGIRDKLERIKKG